jgi:hypothetical protein
LICSRITKGQTFIVLKISGTARASGTSTEGAQDITGLFERRLCGGKKYQFPN